MKALDDTERLAIILPPDYYRKDSNANSGKKYTIVWPIPHSHIKSSLHSPNEMTVFVGNVERVSLWAFLSAVEGQIF